MVCALASLMLVAACVTGCTKPQLTPRELADHVITEFGVTEITFAEVTFWPSFDYPISVTLTGRDTHGTNAGGRYDGANTQSVGGGSQALLSPLSVDDMDWDGLLNQAEAALESNPVCADADMAHTRLTTNWQGDHLTFVNCGTASQHMER